MKYVIYVSDLDKYLSMDKGLTEDLSKAKKFWFFDPSLLFYKNKILKAGSYVEIIKTDWRNF